METENPDIKILKLLLKDFSTKQIITSIAKKIGMSRVGVWKVLKKMQSKKLILLSPVGIGKTNVYNIFLNWENPLLEKMLELYLAEEASKNPRWLSNFSELEKKIDFLIIYGSILHSPKDSNDIDIIGIVSSKKRFIEIDETIKKLQKTQIKKIHILNFTDTEFRQELEKPNKAFVEAIKNGIVLFGQEKFVKFIKSITSK